MRLRHVFPLLPAVVLFCACGSPETPRAPLSPAAALTVVGATAAPSAAASQSPPPAAAPSAAASQSPPPAAAPSPSSSAGAPPRVYRLDLWDARFRYTMPAPEDHPLVKKVEEYRKEIGAPPVVYMLATVDNTLGGKHQVRIPPPTLVTEDHRSIEAVTVDWVLYRWLDALDPTHSDEERERYNRGIEIRKGIRDSSRWTMPGGKDWSVMAVPVWPLPPLRDMFMSNGIQDPFRIELERP